MTKMVMDMFPTMSKYPTGDCDDEDNTIYDGADDAWYDGIDSNCDGLNDYDQDGDTYVLDQYVESSDQFMETATMKIIQFTRVQMIFGTMV